MRRCSSPPYDIIWNNNNFSYFSMKKLPIGISSLTEIRSDDYVYIDKTHHIFKMRDTGGKYYFLSRPRRFGKSLFIDTLKQAFQGNKDLFSGLYLENNWDWNTSYPVLHFSFAGGANYNREESLIESIHSQIDYYAKNYKVKLTNKTIDNRFAQLLIEINSVTNHQIVVLIDEYDKPILDVISNTELSSTNREILKSFYSVLKNHDAILNLFF